MTELNRRIIKNLIFIIFVWPFCMNGQVTFSKVPYDKQLVTRAVNDKGKVIISGEVDKSGSQPNYESIRVDVYRTKNTIKTLYTTNSQTLSYDRNKASFNFSISIDAELANYSLEAYAILDGSGTLINLPTGTGNEIVAGDVYIIQGQSNAEASIKDVGDSSVENESEFIRVYASGTIDPDKLVNEQDLWYYGKGDASQGALGNTGQWGIKLARLILDSEQIPIAIFNGATANRPITYFQAPADYQSSLESNYGRLYHRLDKTGLKESVRGVLWSQGEATLGISTEDYKNEFLALVSSWKTDSPGIQKFYIFQTKTHGLGSSFADQMNTKEAQRQLADENLDIHIMTTESLTSYVEPGYAHFVFTNGYEAFANRIFPLVKRDFYSGINGVDIEPPMITTAYLANNTTLVIETDAGSLIKDATNIDGFQLNNANGASINSINIDNNKIIISLSEYPGATASISYIGLDVGTFNGDFIRNTNNLEVVSFHNYPIGDVVLGLDDIQNDEHLIITNSLDGFSVKSRSSVNKVKVFDILGKLLYKNSPKEKEFNLKIDNLKDGTIVIINIKFDNGTIVSKKVIKY